MELAFEQVYKKSIDPAGKERAKRLRKKLTRKILKEHNLLEEDEMISVEFSSSNSGSHSSCSHQEAGSSQMTLPAGQGARSGPSTMKHQSQPPLPTFEVEELDPTVNPTEMTNKLIEEREQYLSAQIHHDCQSLTSFDSQRSSKSRKKKRPPPLVTKQTVLDFIEQHESGVPTPAKLDSMLKKREGTL